MSKGEAKPKYPLIFDKNLIRFTVVACFLEITISINRVSCVPTYTGLLEFSKYQNIFIK